MLSNNPEQPSDQENPFSPAQNDTASMADPPPRAQTSTNEASYLEEEFRKARQILEGLEGRRLITPVRRQSNLIRAVTHEHVEVATARSPQGAKVPWDRIKATYIELRKRGKLSMIDVAKERHNAAFRISFIFALLLELPNVSVFSVEPFTIEYRDKLYGSKR